MPEGSGSWYGGFLLVDALRGIGDRFHLTLASPTIEEDQEWTCNEHGGVRTHQNTDHHGEAKAFQRVVVLTVSEEQHADHEEGGDRGQNRAAEALVNRDVDNLAKPFLASWQVLANPVEHHNRIVQGVTNDGQERSDDFKFGVVLFHDWGFISHKPVVRIMVRADDGTLKLEKN